MRKFFLILMAGIVIISCIKSAVYRNDGLTGKWKLKEIFNGYAMGGNFQWNPVATANSHILEFYTNGRYEVRPFSTSTGYYNGAYLMLNDSTLARTFSNQADSSLFSHQKISLSPSELIFDYPNIEGVIRYKYSASEN